jgi:hypothetical protein
MESQCPCCGSRLTASRRELFHELMCADRPDQGHFSWYREDLPRACPPKSLFLTLSVLAVVLAIPMVGMVLYGQQVALDWLLGLGVLLLACLAFDVLMTYRDYKTWCHEWLCDECQLVFIPEEYAG